MKSGRFQPNTRDLPSGELHKRAAWLILLQTYANNRRLWSGDCFKRIRNSTCCNVSDYEHLWTPKQLNPRKNTSTGIGPSSWSRTQKNPNDVKFVPRKITWKIPRNLHGISHEIPKHPRKRTWLSCKKSARPVCSTLGGVSGVSSWLHHLQGELWLGMGICPQVMEKNMKNHHFS